MHARTTQVHHFGNEGQEVFVSAHLHVARYAVQCCYCCQGLLCYCLQRQPLLRNLVRSLLQLLLLLVQCLTSQPELCSLLSCCSFLSCSSFNSFAIWGSVNTRQTHVNEVKRMTGAGGMVSCAW